MQPWSTRGVPVKRQEYGRVWVRMEESTQSRRECRRGRDSRREWKDRKRARLKD